ncbi:hypothetical protein BVC80_1707g47 [Macleaya cordata]|uniref:Uncharacterized protein n=1 Tax=Macleaya cordata TaxID=56857 RepID=A0A200Q678_MACCD|nr:hypothetical protein BVC80_1707g47 [Macleaya cordata]
MEAIKISNLLRFFLLNFTIFFFPSVSQTNSTSLCGKIRIQTPFSLQNSIGSSPLSQMLLCKSQKLYFRTSLGLFPVSSIDYKAKTLTISHTSCSSSLHFVSPSLLSAGFPSSEPNSLLLFNCLKHRKPMSSFSHNCTSFYGCRALSESLEQPSSCWFVDDSEKLELGFDPKDLNCSHYSRIYKNSSSSSSSSFGEKYELGTRISFEVPDHIPNICDECRKPEGNCGVGLRCICYPKECSKCYKIFKI